MKALCRLGRVFALLFFIVADALAQKGPVRIVIQPLNPVVAAGSPAVTLTAKKGFFEGGVAAGALQVTEATWSTSNSNIASLNSSGPSSSIQVTPKSSGTATIMAVRGPFRGSTMVTVTAGTLTAISVSPSSAAIAKGQAQPFSATGTFSTGPQQDITNSVTWSSSNTGVATISNNPGTQGLATGVGVGSGAITITAAMNSIQGTASLTVNKAVLIAVTVSPSNPSVSKGMPQSFMAAGTFSDGASFTLPFAGDSTHVAAPVSWQSSNMSVATISGTGTATTVGQGTTTITATSGTVSGTTMLTVTAPVLVSIAVTPANPSINSGEAQQFTATGTLTDNSTQNLTTSVTWSSSKPAIATISNSVGSQGLAMGVAGGASQISAGQSGITGSTTLTVVGTAPKEGILYVAGKSASAIYSWNTASMVTSTTSPDRTITQSTVNFQKTIDAPQGLFDDSIDDRLYAINTNSPIGIAVFDSTSTANGAAAPSRRVFGVTVAFSNSISGVAVDVGRDKLFTSEQGKVRVWDSASTVNGDQVENRDITGLTLPEAIFDDPINDRLYVADFSAPNVSIYNKASTASGGGAPNRKLTNAAITSPAGVTVDLSRDLLYISDSDSSSILIWSNASTVTGTTAPTAVIKGTNTQIVSPCHLVIDPIHDDLYVGSFSTSVKKILVFSGVSALKGTSNIAPSRTITIPSGAPCGVALDPTRQ